MDIGTEGVPPVVVYFWEKTNNFRIRRYINNPSIRPIYKDTLQQQLLCRTTGETKWENVEIVREGFKYE